MKIRDLKKHGISDGIIDLWEGGPDRKFEELLPVQEEAVNKHGLFAGKNILVFSPTSSGKTFVGEMAAIKAALNARKVFYLVPQKALAEEKFFEFRSKYSPYEIKTVISTRDRKEFDEDIVKLDFEIAVVVFEKMYSLVVSQPSLLASAGLIIIDELQMIADKERGPELELLLTKIKLSVTDGQFVGLSAVLGNSEDLAKWLDASIIQHEERPVELRRGILYGRKLGYIEHNSGEKGFETLCEDIETADERVVIIKTALHLANQGEQSLIFRRSREMVLSYARGIAEASTLPPVLEALEELKDFEESLGKQDLVDLLKKGVAYHNSDLDWDLRDLVERYMRAGKIMITVSTSTLAMGLNFPIKNVFLDQKKWGGTRVKWQDITQAEYENQGGRAGRYSYESGFGRSILVAERKVNIEGLWNKYLIGKIPPIEPSLASSDLDNHVLNIVASGLADKTKEVRSILLSSFSGMKLWSSGETRTAFLESFDEAIKKCLEHGLIEEHNGKLKATDLGKACAVTGITVDTCIAFAEWARREKNNPLALSDVEIFIKAVCSEDGENIYFLLARQENEQEDYLEKIRARIADLSEEMSDRIEEKLADVQQDYGVKKSLKKVCILTDWVRGVDTIDIEREFHTYTGPVRNMATNYGWLVDALAKVMSTVGWDKEYVEMVAQLAERLPNGLTKPAGAISRLRVPGLGRKRMAKLVDSGYASLKKLVAAPFEKLADMLGEAVAKKLHGQLMLFAPEALPETKKPETGKTRTETAKAPARKPIKKTAMKYQSNCRIHFEGSEDGKKSRVIIDEKEIWLSDGNFTNFLLIASAIHLDTNGQFHIEGLFGSKTNPNILVTRLRDKLTDHVDCDPQKFIRARGDGHAILSVPPDNITYEVDNLLKHSNDDVRQTAERLSEIFAAE